MQEGFTDILENVPTDSANGSVIRNGSNCSCYTVIFSDIQFGFT